MVANTVFAIVLLTSASLAIPSPAPCLLKRGCVPNTHDPDPNPPSNTSGTIFPSAIALYDTSNGAIKHQSPPVGKIFKSPTNNGHDITTLLTLSYPAKAAGSTCQFFFPLPASSSRSAVVSGSGKVDVYTSVAPAPSYDTTSWPPGNQRNQNLGRLALTLGGDAVWEMTSSGFLTGPTPCGAPGSLLAIELVGVGDADQVEWNPVVEGAQIRFW